MEYDKYKVIEEEKEFEYKTYGRAENKFYKCRKKNVKVKLIGYKGNKPVALLNYNDPANDFNPGDF